MAKASPRTAPPEGNREKIRSSRFHIPTRTQACQWLTSKGASLASMACPSFLKIVDVEYDDPRTGQRVYERRVQEVPWEDLSNVRTRELALVTRRAPSPEFRGYEDRYSQRPREEEFALQRVDRSRRTDEGLIPYRRDDRYDRPAPRRAPAAYDDTDSESSYERRRRHRRREDRDRQRDDRSDAGSSRRGGAKEEQQEGGPRLWYSGKHRKDANILERTFDSSYDGLIAAAAGAALGAITARSFDKHQGDGTDSKQKKVLRLVGGALAGAAVLNAGENAYRIYTEEEEEKKEKKEEKKKEREHGFMQEKDVFEGAGEALQFV
ncbi:hypothetical protein LTR97_011430 [Elasticomyces elasticus]|uniref:Uncharacterized protein n=1 Tax=Elasticomyces elasticus TaxID=574655 RepID=A0AAN7VSC8_9PEZI|nr:hypothetical protein LTR97_011430 [Elasticomyces elasticus]